MPDGRARFSSDDNSFVLLCYFKNGVLQKGPRLLADLQRNTIEIRGQTIKDQGNIYYMKASIDSEGKCKTGFFENDELKREVLLIDSRMLDWVIPERQDRA